MIRGQPETAHTVTETPSEIRELLARHGVRFEQWPTRDLPADADQEAILDAYQAEIAKLKAEDGFQTADVISLNRTTPRRRRSSEVSRRAHPQRG